MKNKFKILLAFIIPIIIIMIVFYCKNMGFTGKDLFLVSDEKEQYLSLFNYFRNVLAGNETLLYAFNKGLGGGMIGTFAYYLSSPLNLVIIFASKISLPLFMYGITLVKIGLCGLFMYLYLKNKFSNKWYLLLFSTIYALTGYTVNYYFDIMWLDSVYMAPLILLGIDKIISGKRSLLYGICLAYAIFCNYYIGYMLCIFSVIYLIYQLVLSFTAKDRDKIIKIIVKFGIASILAGLISAIILIPTVLELQGSAKAFGHLLDSNFTPKFNLLDLFSKTYMGAQVYLNIVNDNTFHIYMSLITLPLMYFYIVNGKIKKKEKIASLSIVGLFMLCFIFPVLNNVWHGFNFPAGMQGRYTFLYCLFLIPLIIKSFQNIKYVDKKHYLIFTVFYLVVSYIIFMSDYLYLDLVKIYSSIGVMILYLLILYSFGTNKDKSKDKELRLIIYALVFSELLFSAYFSVKDYVLVSKEEYKDYIETYGSYINKNKDINYRIESNNDITKIDSLLNEYNGSTLFLSGSNKKISNFFSNAGFIGRDSVSFYNNGNTIVMDSLLGLKNLLIINSVKPKYKEKESFLFSYSSADLYKQYMAFVNVYENPYALTNGYMVNNRINNFKDEFINMKRYSHFEFQNIILNTMLDTNEDYLEFLDVKMIDKDNYEVIRKNNGTLYAEFIISESAGRQDGIGIYCNENFIEYITMAYYGVFPIIDASKVIKIRTEKSNTVKLFTELPFVYGLNEKKFEKAINELKENQLVLETKEKNYMKGKVNVTKDKTMLFTTIPYEKGWSIYVDGKLTPYTILIDAFIGLELTQGEHVLEFKYYPPGLNLGIIVTIISGILFILYMFFENKLIKYIMSIYNKYEEIINYLIVGGLTTVVSILSYIVFARAFDLNYIISSVLSWIVAVTFAYIANKIFVFKSKTKEKKSLIKECYQFFKYRILSLGIDVGLMIILVNLFSLNDVISKIIVQFVIVVLNYLFSKLFIFNKGV